MSYELETANCTSQHLSLKKLPLWDSNSRPSRYSMTLYRWDYVELILFGIHSPDYLFTAGKYIHEATRSTHNRFCSEKKSCPCKARTHDLDIISTHGISIPRKKEVFVMFELTTSETAWRSNTQTNFNSSQMDILRTRLCMWGSLRLTQIT